MIEKKRLEELIEQGAKIYSTHWHEEVDLSLPCEISEVEYGDKTITRLVVFEDEEHAPSYMIDNLTEDIEGAKWEEEFGCIERTERLELPTWEEFKNKKIKQVCFIGGDTICFFELYEDEQNNRLILLDHDCDYEYFNEEITKENYTLACRKAKELFLKGQIND